MQRRTFLSLAGAWRLQASDAPKSSGIWTLEHYYLNRAEEILPLAEKLSLDGVVLRAIAAAHMPQVAVLRGFGPVAEGAILELRRCGEAAQLTVYASLEERAEASREFADWATEITVFQPVACYRMTA